MYMILALLSSATSVALLLLKKKVFCFLFDFSLYVQILYEIG